MPNLTKTHELLLILCSEDDVGLWFAMTPVEDDFEEATPSEIREKTLEVIFDLLEAGLIKAGVPEYDDKGKLYFKTWPLTANETIKRINIEWDNLGHEPMIGEIVWFTSTEKGDDLASIIKKQQE